MAQVPQRPQVFLQTSLLHIPITHIYINSYINLILVWNSGIGFGLLSFDKSEIYNVITILIILINLFILFLIIDQTKLGHTYF